MLPAKSIARCQSSSKQVLNSATLSNARYVSNSPYGRTHVWKRRALRLPNPVVPKFPQLVIRSDGTSFTHWTTSPRSTFRLTRDTTNNPVWNTSEWSVAQGAEEESTTTGRLGRFNRRFEELGGEAGNSEWLEKMSAVSGGAAGTFWSDSDNKPKKKSK